MRTALLERLFFGLLLCFFVGTTASAHPGSGIVVDKFGQIYFTDTGRGVWKIDTHGKLSYIPASQFHWMALDEEGYFAKSQKSFREFFERVVPESSKSSLVLCSEFPLTINRDGNLYYADSRRSSKKIVRRTSDGNESILAGGETFRNISGIANGPDGSIYVTDDSNPDVEHIQRISMDGTVSMIASLDSIKIGGGISKEPTARYTYCRGLAVDSQGVLYVASTGSSRVLKITTDGNVSTILQAPSPWSPTGVALFRGEVYVLEWSQPADSQLEVRKAWTPRVRKVGRDGKVTVLATVLR